MTKPKHTILAIDDEADMLETYRSILQKKYKVITASSGKEALKLIKTQSFSTALLDIRMPKMDGIQVLKEIKEQDKNLEIIMVTASKDVASAVSAMKLGAFDYLTKPFNVCELKALIEKALEKKELVRENLYLRESLKEVTAYYDLIGQTPQMKKLYELIEKAGPTDSTILVSGESGTGKELVARALHKKSKRADKPFVTVNCAAIPENLFESELFGHERGSFTGALERKLGKFELADSGTLFLDEIGCMPASMQAKFLRILEDRIIERVGGEKGIPIDVRIISATNVDFKKYIEEGKFRHDLYYRLNVIPITITPLRERKEDLPLFIQYFLDKYNKALNKSVMRFNREALKLLLDYNWPGNVRELQNLVERVVVLSRGVTISKEELPIEKPTSPPINKESLRQILENFERRSIERVLSKNQTSITRAAKSLKIPRTSLNSRMKALGMTNA